MDGRKLSRAQKRRAAKKNAGGDDTDKQSASPPASSPALAPVVVKATTPPTVVTPPQPGTPDKKTQTTPPKAVVITPPKGGSGSTTPPKPVSTTPPKTEVGEITQSLADMKFEDEDPSTRALAASEIRSRMTMGNAGKYVDLVSNTFELTFNIPQVFRYVVEFTPLIPPERLTQRKIVLRRFKQELQSTYGQYFFDGTNLIVLARQSESNFGPSADGFSIYVRFGSQVSTRDSTSPEVNMYINQMSKKLLRKQKLILIGRSYFYPEPTPLKFQGGTADKALSVYQGFTSSVQPSRCGNLMTIDLCSRVVRQQSVRNMMNGIMTQFRQQQKSKQEYEDFVKATFIGQTILCTYNNRAVRIDDIDFTKSMNTTFELDEAPQGRPRPGLGTRTGHIPFREYFVSRYPEIANKLPPAGHQACSLNGLIVNQPKNVRTTSKRTDYLPELCFLTGLDDKLRSDFGMMTALNKETRLPPTRRVQKIAQLMERIHNRSLENAAEDKSLGRFANPCQLGRNPVELKGRVLPELKVTMPKGAPAVLRERKDFSTNIRSCGFFGAGGTGSANAVVNNFGIVYIDSDARNAESIVTTMKSLASQQGAQLKNCYNVAVSARDVRDSKAWIMATNTLAAKNPPPEFIIFLNPGADAFVYSVMKNATLVQNSIVSQCMDSKKLQQKPAMLKPVCGNTLKQILAKLGWQNWRIDITRHLPAADAKSTMFVGVDVSHDKLLKGSYGSRIRRSTVGFVASRSTDYHAYNSYISYQDPDTEFITEAVRLMKSALTDYVRENKRPPTAVCVYRDGVGDSQLNTFVRREIKMYEQAFSEMNISPKLTVIVVQKRVNLRLFAKCPVVAGISRTCPIEAKCNGRDAYHSPMAGTVVDDTITAEKLSDFYLVPSIAPPGACARPTRFIVLRDDMKLGDNADALQIMTNEMTYQYFNWPGPIRVPACVMYAHKAAYLFGKHVTGNPQPGMAKHLFYL